MSVFYPEDQVRRVLDATDIVSLVRDYVPLKRSGSALKGLCPFHEEKTPSFSVNPARQIYKCFGCGAAGDALSFLMKHDGLGFPEALELLARRAGIELEKSPAAKARRAEASTIYDINAFAAEYYVSALEKSQKAASVREYVAKRGINAEMTRKFRIGYAPDSWDALINVARKKGVDEAAFVRAGLVLKRESGGYYDRFRHRLMFPISDPLGRAIGFGARSLDGSEPKYLNSPETAVFQKGKVLFGLREAMDGLRKTRRAMMMEGYTDVIMAHQYGVNTAVAVLGTALTRDHVRLLRRYVDEALLVLDGDEAGQHSAERSIDAFAAEGMPVKVAVLPDGQDPCDMFAHIGAAAAERIEALAEDWISFKLRRARVMEDGRLTAAGALDGVLATVAQMGDEVTRDAVVKRICAETGISVAAAAARLDTLRRGERPARRTANEPAAKRRRAEYELLTVLLAHPESWAVVADKVRLEWIEAPAARALLVRALEMLGAGETPSAESLLARTTAPEERALIEEALVFELAPGVDAAGWRDSLIGRLRAEHAETLAPRLEEELRRESKKNEGDGLSRREQELLRLYDENARSRQKRNLGLGRQFIGRSGEA